MVIEVAPVPHCPCRVRQCVFRQPLCGLGLLDPLKATLERLVDFDRINSSDVRLTVRAVNVRTGESTSFDTTTHKIDARHIVASGSLPPGFPATEIDGEY